MQTSFLGMSQCSRSSGTTTQPHVYSSEKLKAGGQACTCTTETCNCSTSRLGPDEWIASMRDGLARIFQSPVMAKALRESAAACGAKLSGPLLKLDRANCSWKTAQQSLITASIESPPIFPSWGICIDGACYQQPALVPTTFALDGGAWPGVPTPTATDFKGSTPAQVRRRHSKGNGLTLREWLAKYSEATETVYPSPGLLEKLMLWPTGSTELNALEMDKCHSKPQQPTSCSMQD